MVHSLLMDLFTSTAEDSIFGKYVKLLTTQTCYLFMTIKYPTKTADDHCGGEENIKYLLNSND